MQIIDYVFIACFLIGLIVGVIKGLISQILALLGVVGVAVGTAYLFKFPQQWLSNVIPNENIASIVAIILTFVVLAVVYCVIAYFVKKPFKNIKLMKAIDKILGLVLGVFAAYAIVGVFVALLTQTNAEFLAKTKELLGAQMENSVIVKYVYSNNFFGNWILDIITKGVSSILPQ